MHVLITRPERDAADLKSRIEALGCEVTVAPLLEIAFNEVPSDALIDAAGLIATSRNGLTALAASPAMALAKSLPVFAVGPATALLARELGFATVIAGAGTAADLVPVLEKHADAGARPFVHLGGDHQAFDLAGALRSRGISLGRVEAYRSVAVKTFSAAVTGLLARRALDAVILMSPRTARVWTDLVRALPDKPDLTKVTHVCLSPAVAAALKPLGAVRTEISAAPNGNEIVALVYRLARPAKTG
jgi:uroporphyrinogen-III synthase